MTKAVISGSHGFIGSKLTEVLLSKGWKVVPITQELLYSPKDLNLFFEKERPDYIFHLAAYGNMSFQKDASMTVFANVIGSYNMFKESLAIPYKCFINFGTSSEYGKKFEAMKETDLLVPETFYSASKAAATHLAWVFAKQFEKKIITVRPFSIYGPGEADFRFIPNVIAHMIDGKPFPLQDGNHDWVYIDDFIEAVLLVAENPEKDNGKIINIGTGRMHSNKEVCEMLKKISGIQYLATKVGGIKSQDSEVWMADNTLITKMGWYPKHMLEEGLKETYEFIRTKHN